MANFTIKECRNDAKIQMLNLNSKSSGNSKGSGSGSSLLKPHRLDDLLSTITEARKSLQDWQDKRTEALIQLDALSYDIRQIEEEKSRSADLITALKNEIEDRAKVYQSHVESVTDQMQMLKVEKEDAELKLNEAIQRLQKQLDESELARNRQAEREAEIISDWDRRLNEQKTDYEIRFADQHNRHRQQVEDLNLEINTLLEKIETLKAQVAEAEIRGDRNDRELQVIRSQMMNVLKVSEAERMSDFFKPASMVPAAQVVPSKASAPQAGAKADQRPANPSIVTNAEALNWAANGGAEAGNGAYSGAESRANPRAAAPKNSDENSLGSVTQGLSEKATVEDYLKRLGY